MNKNKCRFCGQELKYTFADLGLAPLSNEYIAQENLQKGQHFHPLHVMVCEECFLVQALEYEKPQNIFSDYKYFSSYSQSWLEHAQNYVEMIIEKLKLDETKQVIEIASNDGYLLQFFKPHSIPVLGIEPAANVAKEAEKKGIQIITQFFSEGLANDLISKDVQADLLIGNNVLAHVPDINDFVKGIQTILKPAGIVTMEFPHLLNLIEENQFDTIYHEHFSYLSLLAVKTIFESKGLKIFDVEELSTHGGSLRIYATHIENDSIQENIKVQELLQKEIEFGLKNINAYVAFNNKVKKIKRDILSTLIKIKSEGKTIAAYGAAAKGNTLLNYCGIGRDFIDYVVDVSPHKQGLYLPGTQIPIVSIEQLHKNDVGFIIILPWNIQDEIITQLKETINKKIKFIICIPEIRII